MIVQYLNEVLDTCQNAGLKMVATVCDMGKPFFRFHNEEIATVYDPPHLLKYDVQLTSGQPSSCYC
jgi:hypothetical protein